MQPPTTRGDGITGELVILDAETIRTRKDFSDVIGIIDPRSGHHDPDLAFNWVRYAQLGVQAVIVAHPEGLESVPWPRVAAREDGIVNSVSINFPRVAATAGIFQFVGEQVYLDLKVHWENKPVRNLYGVLHAPEGANEALLATTRYDATALLPDRALGVIEAMDLAYHLQLVEGMAAYRESLRRDVIFVAFGAHFMGDMGLNELLRVLRLNESRGEENLLLRALGINSEPQEENGIAQGASDRMARVHRRIQENAPLLTDAERALKLFEDEGFLRDLETTRNLRQGLTESARTFFDEQFSYSLKSIIFELNEPLLAARINLERHPGAGLDEPVFQKFLAARRIYDRASVAANQRIDRLLEVRPDFVESFEVRQKAQARFLELVEHHRKIAARLEEERNLVRIFQPYRNFVAFEARLAPTASSGSERVTLEVAGRLLEPGAIGFTSVAQSAASRLDLQDSLEVVVQSRQTQTLSTAATDPMSLQSTFMWRNMGYACYTVLSLDRRASYEMRPAPVDMPWMRAMDSLSATFQTLGETFVSIAHGSGGMAPSRNAEWRLKNFGGQVMASNVGQSIVPNFPLKNAVVSGRPRPNDGSFSRPGYFYHPLIMADPYGHFYMERVAADFPVWYQVYFSGTSWSPLAAGYDEDGFISYFKDEGEDGQRLFNSINIPIDSASNITVVTFRAAPVAVFDLNNPQTMRDYTEVRMIASEGLTPFRKRAQIQDRGASLTFLSPEDHFYALFQAGAPDNEMVRETRAFSTNIENTPDPDRRRVIEGLGYLAADHEVLNRIPQRIARSMNYVNGQRLDLQNRYGMADERTLDFHQRALDLADESVDADLSQRESESIARSSVIFSTLNHPVLRRSVMEAVVGILWYLGLLVPFVFFFEKLVFCYSDVRKQLIAQFAIFVVVFSLLRILHPAFEMVRSSMMIFLGFIIILISGSITLLFTSKFQENLEELRKRQGKVAAADVNKMGILGSAFMLGLNNMNRRKVRTGLTCGTLTLLTFVMISFTSVRNDVVERTVAIGRADYQGMVIKNERFRSMTSGELFALRSKYGDQFDVVERRMQVGVYDRTDASRRNPKLTAQRESRGITRSVPFKSILQFEASDPVGRALTFLTEPVWFPDEGALEAGPLPILIPERMATELDVSAEAIDREGSVDVTINAVQFRVIGIFAAESLDNYRDLDGLDLLPYDVEALTDPQHENEIGFLVGPDDPRIRADELIIAPVANLGMRVVDADELIASVVIVMEGISFREANEVIETFMIQTSQPLHYGIDGISYRGQRARETTLSGLIDLLIPLLIAGLTVLNTMKGSVYERRDEIFVYNAVGIAPRYIFFMFIAEAFVYAVVGSVLGYLLSQGTGRVLTELNLTGGLNMTFASLSTIYASLTIMVAVFLSTYFPAKQAMEIAAPSEESGWKLPEPVEDTLSFDLPFNFRPQGRVAVLSFFHRYLSDHGEGSAGRFFAGVPEIRFQRDASDPSGYVPRIEGKIWLKPFDLGVAQELIIETPVDEETGLYKAHLTLIRLSGTRESWMRLNHGFVGMVRQHFLHWRAVPQHERDEMFEEARAFLLSHHQAEPAGSGSTAGRPSV